MNATLRGSRRRIRITVNSRYADFPSRSRTAAVFGIQKPVATLAGVVQGKLRAATDPARRRSKRSKDELDIVRLAEAHAEVFDMVPSGLIQPLDAISTV